MHSTLPLQDRRADWLVVIDRCEASVFRSLAPGAAPQLIRPCMPAGGTGARPAPKTYLNGRERSRPPAFFEPLAGVLHGADRILIFGKATTLGSEADAFIAWLRGYHPAIARRIVAAVGVAAEKWGESGLLGEARNFFQRRETGVPPASAPILIADRRAAAVNDRVP